jgi:hypothetical protein
LRRSAKHPSHGTDVQIDWFSDLAEAKSTVFQKHSRELECSYLMFSVSLNEAIGLHKNRFIQKSLELVGITAPLCERLSTALENVLRSLSSYCSAHGTDPSVSPLSLTDFQSDRSRLMVLKSLVRHRTLVRHTAQFQNKIRTLREIVDGALADFSSTSHILATEGVLADRGELWLTMDQDHFDLNTCLRESLIVFKCFLQVLPSVELGRFEDMLTRPRVEVAAKPKARAAAAGRIGIPAPSFKWN